MLTHCLGGTTTTLVRRGFHSFQKSVFSHPARSPNQGSTKGTPPEGRPLREPWAKFVCGLRPFLEPSAPSSKFSPPSPPSSRLVRGPGQGSSTFLWGPETLKPQTLNPKPMRGGKCRTSSSASLPLLFSEVKFDGFKLTRFLLRRLLNPNPQP